jgi:hypothetical protein
MFAVRDKIPMRTVTVLPLLLILLSFTSLAAQDTLTAGDKVRVTTDEQRIVGHWVSFDGNRLTLTSEDRDSSLVLPFASLTKLEVSRGQKSAIAKGAGIGFLVGAGVGAGVGALIGASQGENVCSDECRVAFAGIGALAGGAVGTLVSLGIGAASKSERWVSVPLEEIRIGLSLHSADGIAISVSLRL